MSRFTAWTSVSLQPQRTNQGSNQHSQRRMVALIENSRSQLRLGKILKISADICRASAEFSRISAWLTCLLSSTRAHGLLAAPTDEGETSDHSEKTKKRTIENELKRRKQWKFVLENWTARGRRKAAACATAAACLLPRAVQFSSSNFHCSRLLSSFSRVLILVFSD